jgi:hypothetical protein
VVVELAGVDECEHGDAPVLAGAEEKPGEG